MPAFLHSCGYFECIFIFPSLLTSSKGQQMMSSPSPVQVPMPPPPQPQPSPQPPSSQPNSVRYSEIVSFFYYVLALLQNVNYICFALALVQPLLLEVSNPVPLLSHPIVLHLHVPPRVTPSRYLHLDHSIHQVQSRFLVILIELFFFKLCS